MLTKIPSKIRKVVPLICLTFSLNLILTATALGYEPTINFSLEDPKPSVLVQDDTQVQAFILLASSNMAQLAQVQDFIKLTVDKPSIFSPTRRLLLKCQPLLCQNSPIYPVWLLFTLRL